MLNAFRLTQGQIETGKVLPKKNIYNKLWTKQNKNETNAKDSKTRNKFQVFEKLEQNK